MTDRVHLFPRRKAGADSVPVAKGRQPVELTRRAISAMFVMPQPHAARHLGISLTALKQVCRKLGIVRWPYMRSSKTFSKQGGRFHRLASEHTTLDVECALEIDPPARIEMTASGLQDDVQAQAHTAAYSSAPSHDAAAYQSDFEGSNASYRSADTEVARTSSAGSDLPDGNDDCVVRVEPSQDAPMRGNDDSDLGDDLEWLVGCQAEALHVSIVGSMQAELSRAWRCLERCCQAQKAATGVQ